jgi:hypothetical protein
VEMRRAADLGGDDDEGERGRLHQAGHGRAAAAVITSCPKRVPSSPASLSNGSSSPADVDIRMMARNHGRLLRPAPLSA